ncbi:rCG44197 [Rattus norvegicus]|uniref:RCG44197 n=1 Tax=Rattus norvegicus TaxID=10116 RepID=A6J700_RAT|nr:rCG44197 [Rattus norvegicus]
MGKGIREISKNQFLPECKSPW